MADMTHASIEISAPAGKIIDVIADLAVYPEWTDGLKWVEVLERNENGRPLRARFRLESGPIKDTFVLAYDWSGDPDTVSWKLTEGQMLKTEDGTYTLVERGDGTTEVTYDLVVDLNIPMIGLIRKKAEKSIVNSALKGLKRRVESQ